MIPDALRVAPRAHTATFVSPIISTSTNICEGRGKRGFSTTSLTQRVCDTTPHDGVAPYRTEVPDRQVPITLCEALHKAHKWSWETMGQESQKALKLWAIRSGVHTNCQVRIHTVRQEGTSLLLPEGFGDFLLRRIVETLRRRRGRQRADLLHHHDHAQRGRLPDS